MDDWAEADLAWKLVDAISPSLPACKRARLYAAVGAGESYTAITTVLGSGLPLPARLITELRAWLNAYQHSADAPHLHELLRAVPPV
ncbi:MAG TPA: hypothetical protein VMU34_13410 [Mycobacterium sp.]|nr:hypothetical protein [Mycobacterium sp.]